MNTRHHFPLVHAEQEAETAWRTLPANANSDTTAAASSLKSASKSSLPTAWETASTAWEAEAVRTPDAAAFGQPTLLPPGAMLQGRYRIEQQIGQGAFAAVYAAWDAALHRRVAVKAYDMARAGQISQDEAHLQATCQHPNLMPLHDAGHDALAGVSFLVMPLYPGSDLAATLNRIGPMPFRAALLCVDQIASALEFLWQRRGVTHGDVKPANIWLTQDGSALLMDFNLRGLLIRNEGARGGTPGYTAPEAQQGQVTPASDVFALACVLYQCLTGTRPYADNAAACAGGFVPMRRLRPEIRPEIEAVIHRGLDPDPQRRYQSAREFQTALRRPARGRSFCLFLLGTAAKKAGRILGLLYRGAWRLAGKIGRRIRHRPRQACIEIVAGWLMARYVQQWLRGWIQAHPFEALFAIIAILAVAGVWAGVSTARLRRMWRARA